LSQYLLYNVFVTVLILKIKNVIDLQNYQSRSFNPKKENLIKPTGFFTPISNAVNTVSTTTNTSTYGYGLSGLLF